MIYNMNVGKPLERLIFKRRKIEMMSMKKFISMALIVAMVLGMGTMIHIVRRLKWLMRCSKKSDRNK